MLNESRINPILSPHRLIYRDGRVYSQDYQDGSIGFETVLESMFVNNLARWQVLNDVAKLLNTPLANPVKKKRKPRKINNKKK